MAEDRKWAVVAVEEVGELSFMGFRKKQQIRPFNIKIRTIILVAAATPVSP